MHARKICILIAVALMLSAVPATVFAKELPDVVAIVNGDKISKQELINSLIDWNAPMALEQLILYRLVGQEAKEVGVEVTVEDVKAKMDEMKQNMPPGQNFEEMLRQSGMTPGHAFAFLKMQLQAEKIIRQQIEITPEDLAEYRKAQHILIRIAPGENVDENAENEQKAKETIEQIIKEIEEGLDFAEAAEKYSEDQMTKVTGGDLGFFGRGEMVPEFDNAVFEMEPGEISEPIQTPYGIHVIKLVATGETAEGEDKTELEDRIVQKKYGEKYQDWMLQVRNKAEIENVLEPDRSQKPGDLDSLADEQMPPPPPPAP